MHHVNATTSHRTLRIAAALSALVAAGPLAAAPAHAAGATSATCAARLTPTIAPGFTMTPGTGVITTNGQTGALSCVGKIGGNRITGPGSVGVEYLYTTGAACASHTGAGTLRVTLPTTAGAKRMVGAFTIQRTALAIRSQARFADARMSGIGVALPTQGNCFVTPLERVLIVVNASISGV